MKVNRDFFDRIPEIDNLRALAVLAVIANHLNWLHGGFIGVDVFFVISGYVITLVLLNSHIHGNFSLYDFYHHRITRIIPTLFIVGVFVYIAATFLFYDDRDYSFIAQSNLYQAVFSQNIYFASHASEYFHGLTSAKLNLHTWSLAVEEQFYFIYPVIFFFAINHKINNRKFLNNFIFLILSLFAIYSLLDHRITLLIAKTLGNTSKSTLAAINFYLLPTRSWELISGVVTCLIAHDVFGARQNVRTSVPTPIYFIQVLSLSVIIGYIFFYKETMNWPSLATCAPVIATCAMLIIFHRYGDLGLPLLMANPTMGLVGRSSYSLYLWHWPLLSVLTYVLRDFGYSIFDYVIYFSLLITASAITFIFVERNRHQISKSMSLIIFIGFIAFSLLVGSTHRDLSKASSQIRTIINNSELNTECKACVTSPTKKFVVLWGDSHSIMISRSVQKACEDLNLELVLLNGTLMGIPEQVQALSKDPNFAGLFMVARWSMYAVGFPKFEPQETGNRFFSYKGVQAKNTSEATIFFRMHLKNFIESLDGKPILIMTQVPQFPFFPRKEAVLEAQNLEFRPLPMKLTTEHRADQAIVNSIFSEIGRKYKNVKIADPSNELCPNKFCNWREGSNILYWDDDHLSILGAEKLQPFFKNELHKLTTTN